MVRSETLPMIRWPRISLLMLLPVLIAACAAPAPRSMPVDGNVAIDTVEPPDADRHELRDNEDFVVGQVLPDSRPMPQYPSDLLGQSLSMVALCVELSIDTGGHVLSTQPLVTGTRCPHHDPALQALLKHAIDAAVLQWRYAPSLACEIPPDAIPDGTCAAAGNATIAVPMLRAYRFVFRQTSAGASVQGEEEMPQ